MGRGIGLSTTRTGVSGDDFWQVAKKHDGHTGVACSQHRYSVDRADALKVEFLNGKIDRRKRVQRVLRDTTTWLAIFLELNASLVVLGTGTGRPTCEKVLVAKTKSFSAVIDKLWHLYLRL